MSVRELVVLGTSSQVPTRYRNHNGYLLLWDGWGFLFDPGEGTQRQMIHAGVSVTSVTHILITHFHGDHCLGFASLVQRISLDRVPHEIEVHYPASGQVFIDRMRHASIFHDVARLGLRPISESGRLWRGESLELTSRPLDHTVETWGFRIQEADGVRMLEDELSARGVHGADVGRLQRDGQLEVDGQIVRLDEVSEPRPGQSMAFLMDTRPCAEAVELARDVDLLVCESTYLETEASDAAKNGHMTAAQAATIAKEANARQLVLTHFSQRYNDTEPFVREASSIHAEVVAARDGQRVPVPPRRQGTDSAAGCG